MYEPWLSHIYFFRKINHNISALNNFSSAHVSTKFSEMPLLKRNYDCWYVVYTQSDMLTWSCRRTKFFYRKPLEDIYTHAAFQCIMLKYQAFAKIHIVYYIPYNIYSGYNTTI